MRRSTTSQSSARKGASELAVSGEDKSPAVNWKRRWPPLDHGRSSEAEAKLNALLKTSHRDSSLAALARVAFSEAQMMEGRFADSLSSVVMYEAPDARRALDAATDIKVRVQLGLAFSYTGDYPKAIALLNAALRDTPEVDADEQRGAIYGALLAALSWHQRISDPRDYARKSLEHYRHTGDWRGMSEAYVGLSLADMLQGSYESSLAFGEQAVDLIGDRHAPYQLGRIYANMAGACWFLRRPHEGIRHLERAISYYERTEHKSNAALGYNNLGINLALIGEWERAHEALKRALELAFEVDERGAQVPMILDSLGDLRRMRGELDEAEHLLEAPVETRQRNGNKWVCVTGAALARTLPSGDGRRRACASRSRTGARARRTHRGPAGHLRVESATGGSAPARGRGGSVRGTVAEGAGVRRRLGRRPRHHGRGAALDGAARAQARERHARHAPFRAQPLDL